MKTNLILLALLVANIFLVPVTVVQSEGCECCRAVPLVPDAIIVI